MLRSKYYQEGQDSAHKGYARAPRYPQREKAVEFLAGYDSVIKTHMVIRFESNPLGKSYYSYTTPPDIAYVGTLEQCEDKAITLKQSDRKSFYAVYDINGKPYIYKAANEK